MKNVFDVTNGNWRGLGAIPLSQLIIKNKFANIDAHEKYNISIKHGKDLRQGCKCHLVIVGKIKPSECPLFMKKCIPQKPVGACMVSSEGTCRIWAKHQLKS